MKKSFFLIIPLFICSCSNPVPSTNLSETKTQEQKQNPVENNKKEDSELSIHSSKFQIIPIDETSDDQSLQLFVSRLKKIVRQKNLNEFISCLDTGIVSSYGGGMYGIETFLKEWKLDKRPENSLLWTKMTEFLNMGGAWKDSQKTEFCFPYAQSDRLYPKMDFLDWYVTAVSISPKTIVYEKAKLNSKKVGMLSYEIVEILERSEQFTKIRTIDKTISGYVSTNNLIYSASAHPVLEKRNGEWKITSFAPYD